MFAAALLPALAKADDDDFDELLDDDSHLVDELLADEQDELKPTVVDLSNHTWKEFVSFPCRWTGAPVVAAHPSQEPGSFRSFLVAETQTDHYMKGIVMWVHDVSCS